MDAHRLGDPWLSSDDSGALRKYRNHPHACCYVYTVECKHKISPQQKSQCMHRILGQRFMRYAQVITGRITHCML